jgi:hypothetical protein
MVHVVQSCHLDVGFDGSILMVLNEYFENYIPKAVMVAKEMRADRSLPAGWRSNFMLQAYYVSLYLDCPPNLGLKCPSAAAVDALKAAAKVGRPPPSRTRHPPLYFPQPERPHPSSVIRLVVPLFFKGWGAQPLCQPGFKSTPPVPNAPGRECACRCTLTFYNELLYQCAGWNSPEQTEMLGGSGSGS